MRIKLLILSLSFFFFGVRPASAEFTFTIPKTTISSNEEVETTITLSLQGQNNKTYYLEGAFKKEGSSNYFGLTWNDSSWVKYTAINFSSLKSITTDATGKWNGNLKVKTDENSSLYTGSGNYIFQIKRFTSSGSSNYWSDNNVLLVVTASLSSPLPTPSQTSTPLPSTSSSIPTSSFNVSNIPSEINSDQSFTAYVNLSLPDNPNTYFYIKGAFKKAGGSNYFGLTKVGANWIKNSSSFTNQYKITTDSSSNWSGNLEVKPDPEDSGFTGSSNYLFKVGRYKDADSSLVTWSNESNIEITQAIGSNDTNSTESTPQLSTIPTSNPSVSQTKSVIAKTSSVPKSSYQIATVAAVTSLPASSPKTEVKDQKQTNPFLWGGIFLVFAGVGCLGYIYFKRR